MKIDKTKYEILEVVEHATLKVIKAARNALIKEWHPDSHPDANRHQKEECEQKSKEINEAYDLLSDSAKRAEYDKELANLRKADATARRDAEASVRRNEEAAAQREAETRRDDAESRDADVEEDDPDWDWESDYSLMRKWVIENHRPTLSGIVHHFREFGIDRNKARDVLERMISEGYVERRGNQYALVEEDEETDAEEFRPSVWRKAIYTVVFVAIWIGWRSCSTSPAQSTNEVLASSSSTPAPQTSPATDTNTSPVVVAPPSTLVPAPTTYPQDTQQPPNQTQPAGIGQSEPPLEPGMSEPPQTVEPHQRYVVSDPQPPRPPALLTFYAEVRHADGSIETIDLVAPNAKRAREIIREHRGNPDVIEGPSFEKTW